MSEQLTTKQKNNIIVVQKYLKACAAILDVIDAEIQCEGTTGENPVNHTSWDLLNTSKYIGMWIKEGVDL